MIRVRFAVAYLILISVTPVLAQTNEEELARKAASAVSAAASERGKTFAKDRETIVSDASKKDDTFNAPTQDSGEAQRAELRFRHARENRTPVVLQENSAYRQIERDVRSSTAQLGETYGDCVDVPANVADYSLSSETRFCRAQGSMETVEFECKTEGFDYCNSEQFSRRNVPIDTQRSLQQMGVGFYGDKYNLDEPYVYEVDINSIKWQEDEQSVGEACVRTEYRYRLDVPETTLLTELMLSIESMGGFIEVTLNGKHLMQGGNDQSDCFFVGDNERVPTVSGYSASRDLLAEELGVMNNVIVSYTHPASANYTIKLHGRGEVPCDQEQVYRRSCPADVTEAQRQAAELVDKRCSKRLDARHNPEGFFERDCIEFIERYRMSTGPIFDEEEECEAIRAAGCRLTGSTCIDQFFAGANTLNCSLYQLSFQCETTTVKPGAKMKSICGDSISCFGGSCDEEDQIVEDNTDDFKESTSWLTTLAGIKEDLTAPGEVRIFQGRSSKCSGISIAAFSDCCKNSNWGVDFELISCPADEEGLRLARAAGRVIYVGGYSENVPVLDLLVDYELRFYNTFCIYPTKISRIFIEAANEQIGRQYGSAKHPDCSGLTPEELAGLNLDNIDLSEFYPDAMNYADQADSPDNLGAQSQASESPVCSFSVTKGCK